MRTMSPAGLLIRRREPPTYEPGTLQARVPRQPLVAGPLAALVLQNPRTASSGRSGKRFASGFSYFFFSLLACCIVLSLTSDGARNRTATTTPATASGRCGLRRLIRNRCNPFLLTRFQCLGRRAHEVVSGPALTIFAIAVRTNRDVERLRAQVRDLAKEVDRRFGIAVFELPICRTHAAHRF